LEDLQEAYPQVVLCTENLVDKIFSEYPVTVILCEKRGPSLNCPVWKDSSFKVMISPGAERLTNLPGDWRVQQKRILHRDLGGVSNGSWVVTVTVRASYVCRLLNYSILPQGSLLNCLDQGVRGQPCAAPGSEQEISEGLSTAGLSARMKVFPCGTKRDALFLIPTYTSRTGWCRRRLTDQELNWIWDVPESLVRITGLPRKGVPGSPAWVPLKIRNALVRALSAMQNQSEEATHWKMLLVFRSAPGWT